MRVSLRTNVRTVAAAALLALAGCAGSAPAREVAQSVRVPVEGGRLYLELRGADRSAPVLLWLHGGPGGAERPLFRYFNADLERHFRVAYLDQRGAGRSFHPKAPASDLTIRRHLDDLDEVVQHLLVTQSVDRVILLGHSWGTLLGMLYAYEHPKKVSAMVSVAPVVSPLRNQQEQVEFVRHRATEEVMSAR